MSDTKPIASLVLDETIWPRHQLINANVAAMVEAIRVGMEMPPVLIDVKTSKVVDGFHRIHAYQRLYGENYQIPVTTKTYRNREAMVADAIATNADHGQRLTSWDVTRCLLLADEVGMPLDKLAGLLHWRADKLAAYRESRMGTTLDQRKLALKRSLRHRLNQPLNPDQEAANEKLSGMPPMFHVNQLVTLLETDLMPDDDHLAVRAAHLAGLIGEWLATRQPAEEEKGA
jgi:hypothetical protein